MWAPVACVWRHRWPVATLHQTLSEFKVDAPLQFHWKTETNIVMLSPLTISCEIVDLLVSFEQVKRTNVMCQQ